MIYPLLPAFVTGVLGRRAARRLVPPRLSERQPAPGDRGERRARSRRDGTRRLGGASGWSPQQGRGATAAPLAAPPCGVVPQCAVPARGHRGLLRAPHARHAGHPPLAAARRADRPPPPPPPP